MPHERIASHRTGRDHLNGQKRRYRPKRNRQFKNRDMPTRRKEKLDFTTFFILVMTAVIAVATIAGGY